MVFDLYIMMKLKISSIIKFLWIFKGITILGAPRTMFGNVFNNHMHCCVHIYSILKSLNFKLDCTKFIPYHTFFMQTLPRVCKNSFVFSGSCPATIFEGRADCTTPVIMPTIKFKNFNHYTCLLDKRSTLMFTFRTMMKWYAFNMQTRKGSCFLCSWKYRNHVCLKVIKVKNTKSGIPTLKLCAAKNRLKLNYQD